MDVAVSGDEFRGVAGLARGSVVVGRAVRLARWIGRGRRRVTAGQVLRKADVPAAGCAVGVGVPPRLRTMADIRALHRPWCVAVATGLLQVGGGWVTAGRALERWPPGEADLLAGWLAALRAVCAAESYPQDVDSVRLLAMALLAVLGEDGVPRTGGLWGPVHAAVHDLCDRYDKSSWEPLHAADRYYDLATGTPLAGLVALLAEFGAVTGESARSVITPLGRWAAGHLATGLPALADPSLSVGEMIAEAARFGDEEQRGHVAWGWLAERRPAEAAREILAAAEQMSPLLRGVAVGVVQRLGEGALPAWRELTAAPRVGPHARSVLAAWGQGPEPADADWDWLAVEAAAAALLDKGPDEALTRVWEGMPGTDLDTCLAGVRATGHPDAATFSQAVAAFAASGAPRSIDQVAELKVLLSGSRPPIWRRVRLPGHGHPRRPARRHPGALRLGRRPPARVPGREATVQRPAHGPRRDPRRRGDPAARCHGTQRRQDQLHLRPRGMLGARDHAGADAHGRQGPGLPGLRDLQRRLPGGVLVRVRLRRT